MLFIYVVTCDLCLGDAVVKCKTCEEKKFHSFTFCKECDIRWHNHPKRKTYPHHKLRIFGDQDQSKTFKTDLKKKDYFYLMIFSYIDEEHNNEESEDPRPQNQHGRQFRIGSDDDDDWTPEECKFIL